MGVFKSVIVRIWSKIIREIHESPSRRFSRLLHRNLGDLSSARSQRIRHGRPPLRSHLPDPGSAPVGAARRSESEDHRASR